MKKCNKCGVNKSLGDFAKKRSKHSNTCKVCHRAYCRNHYKHNKNQYVYRKRKSYKLFYDKLNALKDRPCMDCNTKYPSYVMDFDHVRGKKSFNIGQVTYARSKSWSKIQEEIEKCELVCANCHRIRTHKRRMALSFNS